MSGKSKERPRRSFAEPEDDEATGLQRKRRNSFSKLQDKLGEESEDAAEVVVAQMHQKNADGTPAHNNSMKLMHQTGTTHAEKNTGSGCTIC